MVYGAIDLHLRFSQIRIIDGEGKVLRESRVVTSADRLVAAFAELGPIRVLVESSTESEWVATALEAAGYEVVVADPNFAPMYGDVRRAVKTDRRDVQALAEANRRGWFRAVYRCSPAQRAQRQVLTTRRQLVRMRTGSISVMRALLRQQGYRVGAGSSERFAQRLGRVAVAEGLAATLAPLVRTVEALTRDIRALDAQLAQAATADPIVERLQTVPGVGPTVAVTFRAFVDDITRFPSAAHLTAALGLVPREHSSAERRHRGHITKVGSAEVRSLLVQAAWACWRVHRHGALRQWTDQLAARRGKRIAVVALARRLSRILYAIWRDDTRFDVRRAA